MSRSHVVDLVTRLIWAALSGTLGDAGITVHPDQPLPGARQPDEAPRRPRRGTLAAGADS
jgi:hypothetical protein